MPLSPISTAGTFFFFESFLLQPILTHASHTSKSIKVKGNSLILRFKCKLQGLVVPGTVTKITAQGKKKFQPNLNEKDPRISILAQQLYMIRI